MATQQRVSSKSRMFTEIGPGDFEFKMTIDNTTKLKKQVFTLKPKSTVDIVVFKKNDCKFCPGMIDILKKVFSNQMFMGKANVFLYEVTKSPQHVGFVKATQTKGNVISIQGVPMTVIFVRGTPSNVYNLSGTGDVQKFTTLLYNLLSKMKMIDPNKVNKKPHVLDEVADIPTGIPYNLVCDDNMCYLTTSEMNGGEEICSDGICTYRSQSELIDKQ